MIPSRRPLDLRALAIMLFLCVIWGAQQSVMKLIAADVAPVMQLSLRFAAASIFFGVLVWVQEGRSIFSDGTAQSGLVLGLLFSLEFIFVGESLRHTSASHTIIFLYTAPVFTALGLQFIPEERLDRVQWIGIAGAFVGILVAFIGRSHRAMSEIILGDLLALIAGACWGVSNVALRRGRIGGAATAKTVLYQVAPAALILGIYAAMTHQTGIQVTTNAIGSMLFQTLIISIASYLIWFWLLRHYLTSRIAPLTLITPLFGVLFAYLMLGDHIEWRFAVGAVLVLAGVLTVNYPRTAR